MPKPQCQLGQPFGGNSVATYKAGGLLGHSGIDNQCGYGTPINSYWDSEYVYKVLTKENPANDGSGFTGIFTIVEQDGRCFEFLYGHCDPNPDLSNPNLLGTIITKNSFIGRESNNGEVYSGADGNERITLAMQKAGDKRGAHRHDQARLLKKVSVYDPSLQYISAPTGEAFFKDGYWYAIADWNNGYRGCYDWTKTPETIITRPPVDTPFITMQKAILAFQLSENINDFKNSPLNKVRYGNKTLSRASKYF